MAASTAPSLLEYARYHGLAIAHRKCDLLSGVSAASERYTATKDNDHLPAFTLPISEDFYQEPKLQLSAAGRVLLSRSIRPPDLPSWDSFLPDHHRVQKLKLEEALIPGDCDQNTWECVVRQSLDLAHQAVQPEILGGESDVALEFLPELLQLTEQWEAEVAQERLQTKREVLGRLRNTRQDDFPPELYETIVAESLQFKKQAIHDLSSPPLVPREDHLFPSAQSPSALDHSVTSIGDYVNSQHALETIRDLAKEDCAIMTGKADGGQQETRTILIEAESRLSADTAASGADRSHSPQILINVQHAQNLASEIFTPNLEAITAPSSDKKTVAFAAILEEYIPDAVEVNGDPEILDDLVETIVPESVLQPPAEMVEDGIPVERNKPADACMRVRVPQLEVVAPVLPWRSTDTKQDDLLGSIIRELVIDVEADQEQSPDQQVGWEPFPSHLAEIDFEEATEAGANLQHFVYSPQEIVQSSQLLWKPCGLRILDDEDGSEDHELLEDARLVAKSQVPPQVPRKRSLDTRPLKYPRKLPQPPSSESSDVSTKAFSASGSLSTFMESRDRVTGQLKQAASHHFP